MPVLPASKYASVTYILALALCFFGCQQEKSDQTTAATSTPAPAPTPALLTQETAPDTLAAYAQAHPNDTLVLISTPKGDIKIRLYKDTPLHRANFVRLAKYGFFDKTVFFRVEKDFMIQGGRSDFQTMQIGGYKIPAEIRPHHFHKRGAVGMARYDDEQNPEKMSSSRDFYIVQGQKYKPYEVKGYMQEFNLNLTPAQQRVYQTEGGAPSLDQQFTVFGEVIEGIEVVDSIAAVEVDEVKWPLKDIGMKVKVIK